MPGASSADDAGGRGLHPRYRLCAVPSRLLLVLCALIACVGAGLVGLLVAEREMGRDGVQTAAVRPAGWSGALRPAEARAPELGSLRDERGRPASMAAYRGKPLIVTFVYSTCEDTCPAQVQTIRGALDDLGADVPVLAVSVDPRGDTPASARRFLNEQRVTGRMRFLLGSEAELERVWEPYGIQPQLDGREHSAWTVLVDGDGRQRIGFPSSQLTDDGLAHDLERLAAEA